MAELIARQQQQQQQQHQISNDISSSANSEVLNSGNFVTDMPEILSVAALNTNHHKNNNNTSSSVAGPNTKTATMHNVRLPSISPTLSLNGSSNDANNGELAKYLDIYLIFIYIHVHICTYMYICTYLYVGEI